VLPFVLGIRQATMSRAALDLAQKSFLVTGASDGIGKHTATKLAKAGATVIVHGRNAEKAQKAADAVRSASGSSAVHAVSADLSSLKEVRRLADDVKAAAGSGGLDVLINNAGIFAERKQLSADGYEMTWAVNVLAPFLLTSLLLQSVNERIVNVSSISAGSSIDFDNLNQEKGFSSHSSYSLSKLAMQMFNVELANKLQQASSKVTANALDPGTVNTKMLIQGWGACGIDIKQANDEFFLAADPSVAGVSGEYFVSSRRTGVRQPAKDARLRRQLWDTLVEQTGAEWQFES
jgi:NAD(P)-dependent dehydrogenase (short-subunit alcohol dehydrogenase family)